MVFLNRHNVLTDHVMPAVGAVFLIACLPFVGAQIVVSTSWGFIWPWSAGTTLSTTKSAAPQWFKAIQRSCDQYTSSKTDGDIAVWAAFLGVVIPAVWLAVGLSGSFKLAIAYNVFRIGPTYAHFAHVYTLSHMEAHHRGKLFKVKVFNSNPVAKVFNFWIGLFHGVLPGTFTESHQLNHHRWNNDINDVYSTAGYPRDSLWSFARYIVVWMCYASNISSMWYFAGIQKGEPSYKEKWGCFWRTAAGTGYYCAFLYGSSVVFGNMFTLVTLVYPFVEGNVLLAVVNWTWHMFLQGGGPGKDDDYVNSTTIENGEEFIFSEEYHVVHHQAPGLHHSKYAKMFEDHEAEGKYDIIFKDVNLFELGFSAMFKNYERLAGMVKPNPKMEKKETIRLLRERLQHCWW